MLTLSMVNVDNDHQMEYGSYMTNKKDIRSETLGLRVPLRVKNALEEIRWSTRRKSINDLVNEVIENYIKNYSGGLTK